MNPNPTFQDWILLFVNAGFQLVNTIGLAIAALIPSIVQTLVDAFCNANVSICNSIAGS